MNSIDVNPPPGMVGYWQLPCCIVRLSCNKKPNIMHRIIARVLLGWKWVEAKNDGAY